MANPDGRKRRNSIGGSTDDRGAGANRIKSKKRRDTELRRKRNSRNPAVLDTDSSGSNRPNLEGESKLRKIGLRDRNLKGATDRYRQQLKESVTRSNERFNRITDNRARLEIARLNQDVERSGPLGRGPLPPLPPIPRLRSNTSAADLFNAKRPGVESIDNFRKKVGDKMANIVRGKIQTLDSAIKGAYQASFFKGRNGAAVFLNKMGDTSEFTIKEIQNDFNRIKNETDIYSKDGETDTQPRDIYIKNDQGANFDNILDTINGQFDTSDISRFVRVYDMDDSSIIHLRLRKSSQAPLDSLEKVKLKSLKKRTELGNLNKLKSKELEGNTSLNIKKLADSIKEQRIKDYDVPVEKWGTIWERKTRPKLFRPRDPIKEGIDTKLNTLIDQKKAKDYDGVEKTLKELDEKLEIIDNKNEATKRLHIAIKQQLRKEQIGRYLELNTGVRSDQKVAEFSKDPRKVYNEVLKRKQEYIKNNPEGSRNFPFPEIEGTLNNMQAYLENIKLRLQFGRADRPPKKDGETPSEFRVQVHANAPDKLKSELLNKDKNLGNKSVLDKAIEDIENLRTANYPYEDAIKQTIQFTKLIDYITYRSKTEPEILALISDEKNLQDGYVPFNDVSGDVYKRIQKQRNEKFETPNGQIPGFTYYSETATALKVYKGNIELWKDVSGSGIYSFENSNGPDKISKRVDWLLENDDIVLFPSFEPLDSEFFVKAQGVPMYMVGILDMEYLNADNIRQSPASFLEHDLFHIIGTSEGKKNEQQYQSLDNAVKKWQGDTDSPKFSKDDIYRFWRKNGDALDSRINKLITDAKALKNESAVKEANDLKDALSMMLFMALHEPIKLDSVSAEEQDGILGSIVGRPTVLEAGPLVNRIGIEWTKKGVENSFVKVLQNRILRGEFGKVDAAIVNQLENAKNWLVNNVGDIFETEPSKITLDEERQDEFQQRRGASSTFPDRRN